MIGWRASVRRFNDLLMVHEHYHASARSASGCRAGMVT
jgi:hypothetical protein